MLARQYAAIFDQPAQRRLEEPVPPPSSSLPGATALFLSETIHDLNEGANFLRRLSPGELVRMRASGRQLLFKAGEPIFAQGTPHEGIFIIDGGRVRVFYSAPSGREITLAYWTSGHFIGGPEICGGGAHMWSGEALEECRITILPRAVVQTLITQVPNFALCLIEGLVAKGKCYSAMAQMLGTRSVIERLAQFLVNVSELYGVADGNAIIINRRITHDQIAAMVGSTRQWVTMMLKRFKRAGIVSIDARFIRIERPERLQEMLFKDSD